MHHLSRRRFLSSGTVAAAGVAATALSGCGSHVSISSDPRELVLWYWKRSISPKLLAVATKRIPGSDKHIRADVIGGTFDTKLRTSIAGGAYIPDITALNSNCSLYFPSEDKFVDLNEHGGREHKADYYDWKWQLGTTPKGRMCFWPMDTGPTGFYYRSDLFAKASLPTDPDEVSAAVRTWDDWIALGQRLRKAIDVSIVSNAGVVFTQFINASPERYFNSDDQPLYSKPGSAIRRAWDVATKAIRAGVTGRLTVSADQNAAWVSGKTAGHVEAVWWAEILKDTAPDTKGKWRLADQPVKPGNSGGSFLAVPTTCKDPQAAADFIMWLTSPANEVVTFNDVQLFPSTPASFTSGRLKSETGFFGPQNPLTFFSQAAKHVPITYVSPYESQTGAFSKELTNVETAGKDPERAWGDAVAQTDRVLAKRGVI